MSKSISISDPSKVQSLKVEPYGSGDKIGGKLNLKIFILKKKFLKYCGILNILTSENNLFIKLFLTSYLINSFS